MSRVEYDDEIVLQTSTSNPGLLILCDHKNRTVIGIDPAKRTSTGFATDATTVRAGQPLTGPGVTDRWWEMWADGLSDVAAWSPETGVFWTYSTWQPSAAKRAYLTREG